MSSKSTDTPSTDTTSTAPTVDLSPMYEAMSSMEAMMAQSISTSQQTMEAMMNQTPSTTATPTVNWEDAQNELKKKISADYTAEANAKKGRESTIIVDPLNDNTPALTSSVLTGK